MKLMNGDCLELMGQMESGSVDAIVTDPPYGLKFMGKQWDHSVPSVEIWAECLRVLKPGGHLLSFAGTRTQHRMAVNIEDAGFEIRDMIAWVYGSGFPKSKNLDGNWAGFGTALKPALEPITMARKPLIGTVAANVLAHGTGAINVDASRIATDENLSGGAYAKNGSERTDEWGAHNGFRRNQGLEYTQPLGRWPANLIHDGSDEVLDTFPDALGQMAKASSSQTTWKNQNTYGAMARESTGAPPRNDAGSAARFFYCAKASKKDRGADNKHPTVKPTDLMRYLCRLVTPPGGTILDPFMGSGSTGKAAALEGFRFIGIELDPSYFKIAQQRIIEAILFPDKKNPA